MSDSIDQSRLSATPTRGASNITHFMQSSSEGPYEAETGELHVEAPSLLVADDIRRLAGDEAALTKEHNTGEALPETGGAAGRGGMYADEGKFLRPCHS